MNLSRGKVDLKLANCLLYLWISYPTFPREVTWQTSPGDSIHITLTTPGLYPSDLAGQATNHQSRLNLGVLSVFNPWLPASWVFAGSRGQGN